MNESITPSSLSRDLEYKAKFPSMESRGRGAGEDIFGSFDSREATDPDNHYAGQNSSHYKNPALDRFIDSMQATVDPNDRACGSKRPASSSRMSSQRSRSITGMMFMSIRSTVKGPLAEDFANMHDSSGATAARNAHLWERA